MSTTQLKFLFVAAEKRGPKRDPHSKQSRVRRLIGASHLAEDRALTHISSGPPHIEVISNQTLQYLMNVLLKNYQHI